MESSQMEFTMHLFVTLEPDIIMFNACEEPLDRSEIWLMVSRPCYPHPVTLPFV